MNSKIRKMAGALLMMVILLLACTSALGESKPVTITFTDPATITAGQKAAVLKTKVNQTVSGEIAFSLTDPQKKTVVYTEIRTGVTAGSEITWSVPYDDAGMSNQKPVKRMRASFVMDDKTYTYDIYYNYEAKKGETPKITIEKASWYYDNTACSFGPAFRNVRPALTDKWYTFTPIDLSIQGRQTFDYAASNMYVIGQVHVDVYGDSVMVTYENYYADKNGKTKTDAEYFTFFPDLQSVTNVEPETMEDLGFPFGQFLSIEKDLAGDTNVLLFVRNRVTYCNYVTDTRKLTRFWPNLPERVALRNAMLDMMD